MSPTSATEDVTRTARVLRVGVYPHRAAETVEWERRELEAAGLRYDFVDAGPRALDPGLLADADALVVHGGPWDADAIAALARCRVLVSCSVGLDWIDVDAATAAGIAVCHLPDVCTAEVAEHTLALLFACVRKICLLSGRVHGGTWDRALLEPMPRLAGKTLGLVGFGRIPRAVARRARALELRVLAHDPFVDPVEGAALGAELVDLATLCREADVVSCHVPLTGSTRGLLGEEHFRAMKPSAYFLNTSRGAVVDEPALVRALREGWIRAAGLDVLAEEPPRPGHPLLGLPNVVLTPHAAGFSDEVVDELPRLAVREVLAVLRGGAPTAGNWANRDALAGREEPARA